MNVVETVVPAAAVASLGYAVTKGHIRGQTVAAVGGGVALAYLTFIKTLLETMHRSVGLADPTPAQLAEEDSSLHPLFRHLPGLVKRLPWRRLGEFPTPVHVGQCRVPAASAGEPAPTISFLIKREDLSSPLYGGNKVRTLEHQLAVVEAKNAARGNHPREMVVFGSGGSNQVVATAVHGLHRRGMPVSALWIADPPDLDNTLNMLSSLSFPLTRWCSWGSPRAMLSTVLAAAFGGAHRPFLLPLGGNNPTGVLGQVSGPLELAEQIARGEVPDVDGIYVPVGSACTISGLIIGVTLARHLGLDAFRSPDFKLHACSIVDTFAALHRSTGFYSAGWTQFFPLSIQHSIRRACQALVDVGGPELTAEALETLARHTVFHVDADVIGHYGVHSAISRETAKMFDESITVTTVDGGSTERPGVWLDGHFCAKAFHSLATDLQKPENLGKNMMLWQTKSVVQPRGSEDEWTRMKQMPQVVQEWANKGKAESVLRPGAVNVTDGDPEDYRGLTTTI